MLSRATSLVSLDGGIMKDTAARWTIAPIELLHVSLQVVKSIAKLTYSNGKYVGILCVRAAKLEYVKHVHQGVRETLADRERVL